MELLGMDPAPPLSRRTLLVLLATLAFGQARSASAAAALAGADVLALVRRSSPLGKRILDGYLEGPMRFQGAAGEVSFSRLDPEAFVTGHPPEDLVSVANTVVHEICHSFCRVHAYTMDPRAFTDPGSMAVFPTPEKTLFVPGLASFPAREAAASFPSFLRETTRFDHYVESSIPTMGTQTYGFLGLLDEFGAYYVGTRAACDAVRSLLHRPAGDPYTWIVYLTGADCTVGAYQEFRGYLLAYLAYAREKRPEVYRRLVGAPEVMAAWKALDQAFGSQCRAWYRDLPGFLETLRQAGIPIRQKGDLLYAGQRGRKLFREEYFALEKAIRSTPSLRP